VVNSIVIEMLKMRCVIGRNEFNSSHGMVMPVGAIQLVQNLELVAGSNSSRVTTSEGRTSLFQNNTI